MKKKTNNLIHLVMFGFFAVVTLLFLISTIILFASKTAGVLIPAFLLFVTCGLMLYSLSLWGSLLFNGNQSVSEDMPKKWLWALFTVTVIVIQVIVCIRFFKGVMPIFPAAILTGFNCFLGFTSYRAGKELFR